MKRKSRDGIGREQPSEEIEDLRFSVFGRSAVQHEGSWLNQACCDAQGRGSCDFGNQIDFLIGVVVAHEASTQQFRQQRFFGALGSHIKRPMTLEHMAGSMVRIVWLERGVPLPIKNK